MKNFLQKRRLTKRPEKHRDNASRLRFAARGELPDPRANTEDTGAGDCRLRRRAHISSSFTRLISFPWTVRPGQAGWTASPVRVTAQACATKWCNAIRWAFNSGKTIFTN